MRSVLAGSLGASFFLIPLYPAFIRLTGAPVPGISLVPKPAALVLLAVAATIAVSWLALLLSAPKQRMPTLLPVAAFAGAALFAALLGFDPLAGALFIAILCGGVIWHVTILRFFRESGVAPAIFAAYLISGALASLAAVVMVLTKTPPALYTIGHGRAIGTFVLPGELAGYLILYVPVAFALARAQRGASRALASTGVALGALAFVLTFSRAGWAGMAAAVAALVLLERRGRGIRYAAAIAGTAAVVVALAFNAHHDPSENFTRLSIWETALQIVYRFPFSGVGPFEFARIYPVVRVPGGEPVAYHAHSIVLTILAETGLAGITALFVGWWRFAVELRHRLQAQPASGAIAIAITAGLAGTWVQGLIDTISVVIFGLWLPFMALALASAEGPPAAESTPAEYTPANPRVNVSNPHVTLSLSKGPRSTHAQQGAAPRIRRRLAVTAALIALPCMVLQTASSAVYAAAASPLSLPAHLPAHLGTRLYEAMERIAPLPFVEAVVAEDALRRSDLHTAAEHATRIPPGPARSDFEARIAAAQGRTADAITLFLEAGDDGAIHAFIPALVRHGRIDAAYALESRLRERLAQIETRPNALADSWWRLGRLAIRRGDAREAARDYDRATALAPFNTKYLLEAGTLALEQRDPATAETDFSRALAIDPTDADAVAGLGLAAFQRGNVARARQLSAQADAMNLNATLALRLRSALNGP